MLRQFFKLGKLGDFGVVARTGHQEDRRFGCAHAGRGVNQQVLENILQQLIGQQSLQVDAADANKQARDELRSHIDLATTMNQHIKLDSLVTKFSRRPYGWPEWEVVLLVARLFMAGDLNLLLDGDAVSPKDAIDPLTKSMKWKQVTILKRKAVGEAVLKTARTIGQEIFHLIGPDAEDQLNSFLRKRLQSWRDSLGEYRPYAKEGKCPGYQVMLDGEKLILKLLAVNDSFEFFSAFIAAKADLLDLADDMQELTGFYTTQKPTWDKLRNCMSGVFKLNRQELEKDSAAKQSLRRMDEILMAPRPYGMIKEVEGLIATVSASNTACITKEQGLLLGKLEEKIAIVAESLETYKASAVISNQALKPLQDIKKQVQEEQSIPNMHYQFNQADDAVDSAFEIIEKAAEPPVTEGKDKIPAPTKITKYISASTKTFLESEADVNLYLEALRKELMIALAGDCRVKVK